MRGLPVLAGLLAAVSQGVSIAEAGTFPYPRARDIRRLNIVRLYDIPITKGQRTVAGIPALMSFWGATNQQVILDSRFDYSLQPDRIEITADSLGMLRRNYELTWDAPQVDVIRVKQTLVVELACQNTLITAARLPYPQEVRERFASSLASTRSVNCEHPKVRAVAQDIARKAASAEEAVELACDWVDENIAFQSGSPEDANSVLASGKGNCGGMSQLACAILRSMGIPAEVVSSAFIGGGGHAFLEAYFPDAGWVFYDVSNSSRGFKTLDGLVTAGFSFRVQSGESFKWHEGRFLDATDASAYEEDTRIVPPQLRAGPRGKNVQGVRVLARPTPRDVKVRHESIRTLLQDLSIPPGKREYQAPEARPPAGKAPGTPGPRPAAPAATKPAVPQARPQPAPAPEESPAARRLKVARMYLNGGLTDKAEAILRQLVQDAPDTPEAQEAARLLKDMGKRE